MDKRSEKIEEELEGAEERDPQRVERADEVCSRACEESGVQVASWRNFSAWKEYVDGKIGDAQLTDRAKGEITEYARVFGKYLVVGKKEESRHKEDEDKLERAKRANKIYRQVCTEAGLTVCFFHDFKSWSDYVEGKISDEEFLERARAEVEKMKTDADHSGDSTS